LNTDFGTSSEGQDCKIGSVGNTCWEGERKRDEGIWLMGFIYLHEINIETFCSCFKWGREGGGDKDDEGNLTNV
jgi:hypothetical protein